jgi:carboxyl-terminal processing protease
VPVSEGNILYPYGDPKDPLLGEALFRITGTHDNARGERAQGVAGRSEWRIIIIDQPKAGGSNMFYDR